MTGNPVYLISNIRAYSGCDRSAEGDYTSAALDPTSGVSWGPCIDTLNLTTDIWNGAHGGCDQSAEDAYSSMAPDPAFAFVGGRRCTTLEFVIAFWIMIAF